MLNWGGGRLGQFVSLVLVLLLLAVSSPVTFGQVLLEDYDGSGLVNYGNGLVANHSDIHAAEVWGSATLINGGHINTADVYERGVLHNWIGTIGTVNAFSGVVGNDLDGFISTVIISGGTVQNHGGIHLVNIESGVLENVPVGSIDNVTMDGGEITNSGQITNMDYWNGTYDGANGTINKLTVYGQMDTSANWGTIGELEVDANGLLLFTDLFSSLNAQSVNFVNGAIQFDLSAFVDLEGDLATYFYKTFGGENGFDLTSLFAEGAEVDFSGLYAVTLIADGKENFELLGNEDWVFEDGKFVYLTTEPPTPPVVNPDTTPEPATLLMLSLGAIGAGLAARRKMRNVK